MSVAEAPVKLLTLAEFVELPGSDHMELVDGVPVEKEMAVNETFSAGEIAFYLRAAQGEQRSGRVGVETLVQVDGATSTGGRRPDVLYISFERLGDFDLSENWLDVVPEIVVEVISPKDKAFDVDRKRDEYLAAGVLMVVQVVSATHSVSVFRADDHPLLLQGDTPLTAPGILPNLSVPVSKLFPPGK